MKKLIIAAAAAMLGIAANAAVVSWNVGIGEMDSNYGPAVGSIVLATGSDSWSFDFDEYGSATGVINGDTTGIFATGTEWTATITADLFKEDSSPAGSFTKSYTFTMPALTGDPTIDAGTLDGLNSEIALAFGDPSTGALPTSEAAAAAGWTPAGNIPEPTSGLLLLLGVAGLALRRKSA